MSGSLEPDGRFGEIAPPPFAPEQGAEGVAGVPLRSMLAGEPASASRVASERRAQPNGVWGMALFVAAEATLFGTLIATYFYLDFQAPRWPPYGVEHPAVLLPSLATAALVLTTVLLALASRAARAGAAGATTALLAGAFAWQCGYLAFQLILFSDDLGHVHPQGSAYGSVYFTLLAVHHAHVLIGLLLDAGMLWWLATKGLTNYRLIGVRALAIYWYVVAALAVAVLFTQISPSL